MRRKIAVAMSMIVLAVCLMGCFNSAEPILIDPTFPMTFTRISDGVQVRLGMHRNEVGEVLEPRSPATGELMESYGHLVFYDGVIINYSNDRVTRIATNIEGWVIAGEITMGTPIQSVLNHRAFRRNHIHEPEVGIVTILERVENSSSIYSLRFLYDLDGYINGISLDYLSE